MDTIPGTNIPRAHSLTIGIAGAHTTNPGMHAKSQWTNTLGFPIYVYRMYPWLGVDMNVFGDMAIQLTNVSTGEILIVGNDDHYKNRGGLMNNYGIFDATPAAFLVNPGDVLQLDLVATGPYFSAPGNVALGALIYYMQ